MDRRVFLASAGTVAATALLPKVGYAAKRSSGLSILQGLTTETTTQLTVDVLKTIQVAYLITDVATGKTFEPDKLTPVTFGSSDTRVDKLSFVNLELGHLYKFTCTDKAKNTLLDERFLSTVDLNKQNARFALMSCMHDSKSAKDKIWPKAERANLDYLFFLGDNVYGDFLGIHGPNYLWSRYIQSRQKIPYYRWKNLKPVIAGWDDHDFGKNDEDGSYRYKNEAFEIFNTFFAQDNVGDTLMNGVANSRYFQAFGQNFAFFDSRYFRGYANPDGSKAFLGQLQIDWMSAVIEARPKPTWVLNGSPIYGRNEKQASYQHHAAQELESFLNKTKRWNSPVIFGAGDLHFSEVSAIDKSILGYETFELVSSSMHSTTKSKYYDNPNPRIGGFLQENFLVVEQVGGLSDPSWKVTCIDKDAKVPFELNLKIS